MQQRFGGRYHWYKVRAAFTGSDDERRSSPLSMAADIQNYSEDLFMVLRLRLGKGMQIIRLSDFDGGIETRQSNGCVVFRQHVLKT